MIGTVNRNPSRRDLQSFGIVILCGLGVIGGLLWISGAAPGVRLAWRGSGLQMLAIVLWTLAVVVSGISLSSPAAARPIYIAWMTLAMWMGAVMVPVMLTILYFTLLAPFALIRLKDPLRRALKSSGSYWEDHPPHEPTIDRMMRPF